METSPEERRKPLYDLLEATVNRLMAAHREAIQAVVAALPDAAAEMYMYHRRYAQALDDMLVKTKVPEHYGNEPLWYLLRLLSLFPADWRDFEGNIEVYSQIQERFGLPVDDEK